MSCALTYDQLLEYTGGETARWREWLSAHPEALDAPFAEGRLATVRGVILHIFAVELRYAERLVGREKITAYEELTATSIDELFAVGERARLLLREYLGTMTEDDARIALTFETISAGELTASKHKIVVHALLHGIRHWAQIASALRAAGFPGQWGHDILLTPVEM